MVTIKPAGDQAVTVEFADRIDAAVNARVIALADALKARPVEGIVETVSGSGIAGKQPTIEPGARYAYQSAAPLDTPSGIMVGHYIARTADNRLLKIDIPAFSLDSPYDAGSRH